MHVPRSWKDFVDTHRCSCLNQVDDNVKKTSKIRNKIRPHKGRSANQRLLTKVSSKATNIAFSGAYVRMSHSELPRPPPYIKLATGMISKLETCRCLHINLDNDMEIQLGYQWYYTTMTQTMKPKGSGQENGQKQNVEMDETARYHRRSWFYVMMSIVSMSCCIKTPGYLPQTSPDFRYRRSEWRHPRVTVKITNTCLSTK